MNNKKYKKGFSLIELVLVMFIISFSFIGIYRVLARVSYHEKDNRYNIIAANLAQEGIEIIRNKRDNGILNGDDLDTALPDDSACYPYIDSSNDPQCEASNRIKEIGIKNNIYENCESSGCEPDFEETPFERECSISGDNTLKNVECTVIWESPTLKTNKEIKLEGVLTNWQSDTTVITP